MSEQIYLITGGVKAPARLDVYKHGAGIYVSIQAGQSQAAISGDAASVMAELRRAADLIERATATNDQGHVSRAAVKSETPAPRLSPYAKSWDGLTSEIIIAYFEQSPDLSAIADDVRAVLGKAWPASAATATPAPLVPSQLELDLETIRPHLSKITAGGKINKSAIGRLLGIAPSGPLNMRRLTEIAENISSSSEEEPRPDEMAPESRSAA